MISTHHPNKNVAIMVGAGFAENDVVFCLSQMRSAGLPVSLISPSNKLVHSQHGLAVCPDYSLNQLTNNTAFYLLIIPGNYECVTHLLTSPDFHYQIKQNLAQNGYIAILNHAEAALQQANLFITGSNQLLFQRDQSLDLFCQKLIQIISAA